MDFGLTLEHIPPGQFPEWLFQQLQDQVLLPTMEPLLIIHSSDASRAELLSRLEASEIGPIDRSRHHTLASLWKSLHADLRLPRLLSSSAAANRLLHSECEQAAREGEFPILHKDVPLEKVTWTTVDKRGGIPEWNEQTKQWEVDMEKLKLKVNESDEYYDTQIDNLRDYFYVLEKQKVTHLLLDENNNSPLINDELKFHLKDIFNHENKYPFLIKEYDSRENGFNYYVKVFEIDYDLLGERIN